MGLIADILLVAAALGATFYCVVLSRRLNRFTDLENGVGGAIAALSAQVDDMTRTLKSAQGSATASASSLGQLTTRAEDAARRLELLVASMHDLPAAPEADEHAAPEQAPVEEPERVELQSAEEDAAAEEETASEDDSDVAPADPPAEETDEGGENESPPTEAVFSSRRSKSSEAA